MIKYALITEECGGYEGHTSFHLYDALDEIEKKYNKIWRHNEQVDLMNYIYSVDLGSLDTKCIGRWHQYAGASESAESIDLKAIVKEFDEYR